MVTNVRDLLKSTEFISYVDGKGIITPPPAKTVIPPKVEETKIEPKETKVETKNTTEQTNTEAEPVKEPTVIQPEVKSPDSTVIPPSKEEDVKQ